MAASTAAKEATARNEQSKNSKMATLDMLKSKGRAKKKFTIHLPDEDGNSQEVELVFQAIGANDYDKLVGKHPPTTEQRADGASFNIDTFAPALIAAVSLDPEISPSDAREIWSSSEWSRGEVVTLWRQALELCNRGLDIPFTVND